MTWSSTIKLNFSANCKITVREKCFVKFSCYQFFFQSVLEITVSSNYFCYCKTEVIFEGELVPQEAPSNLTLLEIRNRQVIIEWDPINPQSVRGNFKAYLVRTWDHAGSQVYAFPPDVTKANVEFFPFSKNFITVSVRNEKYIGPPSEAISFDAPQIGTDESTEDDIYIELNNLQ